MLRSAQWKFGVVAFLGFSACSEGPPPTASTANWRSLSAAVAEQPGQDVALGIAQALANPTIRLSVLQAFRGSPWVEHKLVLQQFIATTAGMEMVAAAATARGVTAAEFTNQINALPLLDFYVPSRSERLSWSGDNTVGVALSTSMKVVPTSAYISAGTAIPFASAHAMGRVLVLLHPAEAKGRRMQRQAALVGSKIQDSDDGDIGVQFIQKLGNGDSVVYDLKKNASGAWVTMQPDGSAGKELAIAVAERAAAAQRVRQASISGPQFLCGDECGGGPGGGNPPPSTNVTRIQTRGVCDMDCSAGNEFEFRAKAYSNSTNALVTQGTARITGVQCCSYIGAAWSGSMPMILTTIASGVYIDVDVVETDSFSPDDNFDPNPVLRYTSDQGRRFDIGDPRYPPDCADTQSSVCRELSVDFNW